MTYLGKDRRRRTNNILKQKRDKVYKIHAEYTFKLHERR
jgi:hypothetical protein